jgi:hypothetical protein
LVETLDFLYYNIIVKPETRKINKEQVILAPLDNGTIFKAAFTDKTVFKSFVKDILGIEIEVDKIETEKKFEPKVGYIDITMDIFAESVDHRLIIEIQRVDYDYNFDRFLHYYRDWLDLIYESIHNPENYHVNLNHEGIKKVVELIEYENLTGEQLHQMKIDAQRKVVRKIDRNQYVKKRI